jgi:hypothetical protein
MAVSGSFDLRNTPSAELGAQHSARVENCDGEPDSLRGPIGFTGKKSIHEVRMGAARQQQKYMPYLPRPAGPSSGVAAR